MFANSNKDVVTYNLKAILMEEIALDGLTGISLERLWNCVVYRTSSALNDKFKECLWNATKLLPYVTFYELPIPLPHFDIQDRFSHVDEFGNLVTTDFFFDGPYVFAPIEGEHGSCEHYHTRKKIPNDVLQNMSYKDVYERWGDKIVAVASFEERAKALGPHVNINDIKNLIPPHYCLLELIGKSRENGQLTMIKTNFKEIVKTAKLLFYTRKLLKNLDLIKSKTIVMNDPKDGVKNMRPPILIWLKRFERPNHMLRPRKGKYHELAKAINEAPEKKLPFDKAKIILGADVKNKDFQKKKALRTYYQLVHKDMKPSESKGNKKNTTGIDNIYVTLNTQVSDESSSESELEENYSELPAPHQKIGVSLIKQVIDLIKQRPKGLSLMQIRRVLCISFYSARKLYQILKKSKLFMEIFTDVGRQKTGKLICKKQTGEVVEIQKEKQKLIEIITKSKHNKNINTENDGTGTLDKDDQTGTTLAAQNPNSEDALQYLKSKKCTLKSLKLLNSIIKTVNKHEILRSYFSLRHAIERECGLRKIDTTFLKKCVHALAKSKQLRLFKLENKRKKVVLICATHITKDHPSVVKMFKEYTMNFYRSTDKVIKRELTVETKVRKSLRIPKFIYHKRLHILLFDLAYNNNEDTKGFVTFFDLLESLTVEEAYSLICLRVSHTPLNALTTYRKTKIKDAPEGIYQILFQSHHIISNLRYNLKCLVSFGLLQMCSKDNSHLKLKRLFTMQNQNMTLYVNRNVSILNTIGDWPSKLIKKRKFYLSSTTDVEDFWNLVQNIALRTNIVCDRKLGQPPEGVLRAMDEVQQNDDGNQILGDGRGPCGFDSSFYMDLSNGWNRGTFMKRKSTNETRQPRKKKPKLAPVTVKVEPTTTKSKKKTTIWDPWEDRVLIICRAAQSILSLAVNHAASKTVCFVTSEILAKLGSDKSTRHCMNRISYLELHDGMKIIEAVVNKMTENQVLVKEFKNQFLHLLNQQKPKYFMKCKERLIELLITFVKFSLQPKDIDKFEPIAKNMNHFNQLFCCEEVNSNDLEKMAINEHSVEKIAFQTMCETVLFTISNKNNTQPSMPIYNILSQFDDIELRLSLNVLQQNDKRISKSAVSCNESSERVPSYYFKLSHLYMHKIENRFLTNLLDAISKIMNEIGKQGQVEAESVVPFIFTEMLAKELVDLHTKELPSIKSKPKKSTREESEMVFPKVFYDFKQLYIETENLHVSTEEINQCMAKLNEEIIVKEPTEDIESSEKINKIVTYLEECKEVGATFTDIANKLGENLEEVSELISTLVQSKHVHNVGYKTSRLVLHKYIKPWTFKFDDLDLIPAPWLNLEKKIELKKFIAWCTTVIYIIIENPGATCDKVSEIAEYITPMNVKTIAEFLKEMECVKLVYVAKRKINIFDDVIEEINFDTVPKSVSPEQISIVPQMDYFSRFTRVRQCFMEE